MSTAGPHWIEARTSLISTMLTCLPLPSGQTEEVVEEYTKLREAALDSVGNLLQFAGRMAGDKEKNDEPQS